MKITRRKLLGAAAALPVAEKLAAAAEQTAVPDPAPAPKSIAAQIAPRILTGIEAELSIANSGLTTREHIPVIGQRFGIANIPVWSGSGKQAMIPITMGCWAESTSSIPGRLLTDIDHPLVFAYMRPAMIAVANLVETWLIRETQQFGFVTAGSLNDQVQLADALLGRPAGPLYLVGHRGKVAAPAFLSENRGFRIIETQLCDGYCFLAAPRIFAMCSQRPPLRNDRPQDTAFAENAQFGIQVSVASPTGQSGAEEATVQIEAFFGCRLLEAGVNGIRLITEAV